jgi:glycerophosphoryl diester phosphodiesterase
MKTIVILFSLGSLLFAAGSIPFSMKPEDTFDLQGHRGCRGLYPENTIEGFRLALNMGVNTLEMDVVISGDDSIVVSHEPWLSHEICSGPAGEIITEKNEKDFNLYKMPYSGIAKCDCGSKPHPRFPSQRKINAYKPLLRDVIRASDKYGRGLRNQPPRYNIELKLETAAQPGRWNPEPDVFAEKVIRLVKEEGITDRVTLQSFDLETLRQIHAQAPEIQTALLVENKLSFPANLEALGFIPQIYSPDFVLVNEALVKEVHEKGMKIIPWTVNEKEDMIRLKGYGVDGLITDFPNRFER